MDAGAVDAGAVDAGAVDAGAVDAGARPHPLYPSLDLASLPGAGGAASGAYEPPALPTTTRTVTANTRAELLAACQVPGTAVSVPDSAGRLGGLDFGNVTDCDVTLGAQVVADFIYIGHLPGPTVAPTHRLRIRGGQIGSIVVDPGSSDLVLDGVIINNSVVPPALPLGDHRLAYRGPGSSPRPKGRAAGRRRRLRPLRDDLSCVLSGKRGASPSRGPW